MQRPAASTQGAPFTPFIRMPGFAVILAAVAAVQGPAALAQEQDKRVSVIVPMSAGTGVDVLARLIADQLQQRFKQPFVVENRSGASGNIGATAVARAAPDGHTLLVTVDPPFTANLNLRKTAPYDPAKDFVPIVELAVAAPVLAIHASVPANSTRTFVEHLRAHPGKLSYGTSGVGTPHHLTMELFKLATRTDMRHVPFKDSAGFIAAFVGGHVSATFVPLHFALPLPRDKIRLLALAAGKRAAAASDIPTLNEEGLSGLEAELRFGLFAPAGTPPALVARYNAAVNDVLRMPEVVRKLGDAGLTPVGGSADQYAQAIAKDILKWRKVIEGAGISAN